MQRRFLLSVHISRRLWRVVGVLVPEVQSKFRLRPCTRDFDWHLSSRAVFSEEWVGWFQQDALPSRGHLGQVCVHSRLAMKVELISVEAVNAVNVHSQTGNGVLQ